MADLKTVVGLFDDMGDARDAVRDLSAAGFSRADLSLMANASADDYGQFFDEQGSYRESDVITTVDDRADYTGVGTGAGIGAVLGGLAGLLVGLATLPVPGVGPVVAAGPVMSALLGAAGGAVAGGIIGVLTHVGVPDLHAPVYAEGVRRGGTLVMVRSSLDQVDQAMNIMGRHNPVDLEARATDWRSRGWQNYDAAAPAFTRDEVVAERARYRRAEGTGVGMVGGAALGAAAGSAVAPGFGTAAGAIAGGAAGAMGGREVADRSVPPLPDRP